MKHFFFYQVFKMLCSKNDIAYTFFMKSHPLDQGLPSFKNSKLASCFTERDAAAAIPFGSLFLSYFGLFGCQENSTFLLFSKLFSMNFLEKKNGLISSFISQFLIYVGLGKNSFSSYVDSKRGQDRA